MTYKVDPSLIREDTAHGYRRIGAGQFLSIQFSHNRAGRPLGNGHSHPYEQLLVVLKGTYLLYVGDEELKLDTADVVLIPADVFHRGRSLSEESLTFSVFAPPRPEDLRASGR